MENTPLRSPKTEVHYCAFSLLQSLELPTPIYLDIQDKTLDNFFNLARNTAFIFFLSGCYSSTSSMIFNSKATNNYSDLLQSTSFM